VISGVEISKRLVLINSASTVVRRVLTIGVQLWVVQYLVRGITAEEYSLIPVLSAVMVFAPLLTAVLTSGIARYVTEAYARGDEERVTQIVSTIFPLLLVTSGILLAGGGLLAWHVDKVLTVGPGRVWDARIMLGLMVFVVAFRLPLMPFGVGLYVRQKFVIQDGLDLVAQVFSVTLLLVLLFTAGKRAMWVVVANSARIIVDTLMRTVLSRRSIPALRVRWNAFRWHLAKDLTSFGAWRLVGHIGTMLQTAANPLVLNKLGTAVDVTAFHVGSMPSRQIDPMMMEVTTPLQPALVAMHVSGDRERLRYTYMRIGRMAMWATLLVAAPLAVFHRELFQLYLREKYPLYASAGIVMVLFLAGYPILHATNGLLRIAVATVRLRRMMLITLAGQLAGVGLALYFVAACGLGAIGCAVAAFTANALTCFLGYWPLGLRLLDLPFGRFARETLLPGIVPGLAGVYTCLCLRSLVRPTSWVALGGCAAAGCAAYLLVLFGLCLRPSDRNDLRRVLARVLRRGGETEA